MGAAILYAKDHSWGEFVFDHAWANAHQRNGIPYYPKLVAAIPFTPVAGPRLIARNAQVRAALAKALPVLTRSGRLSSVHLLFPQTADEVSLAIAPEPAPETADEAADEASDETADEATDHWLRRTGVQFHWQADGWTNFEDFLNSMAQPKRKKIRAERRKVAEAGVTVRVVDVAQSRVEEREFFIACYERTYYEHGGPPYLNHEFWNQVFNTMPEHFALVLAQARDRLIASSLIAHDGVNAWGRYWGAMERVPCLHFECCYYAPIEWAIQRGFQRFEGGAQGEHKLARGLLPVATSSYHWLSHPAFETAIERWLNRERSGVAHYLDELDERSPLRDPRGETS
jgi:predicted N-acyltransferase